MRMIVAVLEGLSLARPLVGGVQGVGDGSDRGEEHGDILGLSQQVSEILHWMTWPGNGNK